MIQKMPLPISDLARIENPFWAFSLKVYDRKVVKDACLALQDRFGADVNILLFLCWRNSIGLARPTDDHLKGMIEAVADINREVISPLRKIRTLLPGMDNMSAGETRKKVLAAELSAEQMAQATLFTAFPPPARPLARQEDSALHALISYLETLGINGSGLEEARPLLAELANEISASIRE